MKKLILDLDFLSGPIWKEYFDPKTHKDFTGIPVIDNNKELLELDDKIMKMYSSYYEFDKGDEACSINYELYKKERPKLQALLDQLYKMIDKLNDGSFEIENRIDLDYLLSKK